MSNNVTLSGSDRSNLKRKAEGMLRRGEAPQGATGYEIAKTGAKEFTLTWTLPAASQPTPASAALATVQELVASNKRNSVKAEKPAAAGAEEEERKPGSLAGLDLDMGALACPKRSEKPKRAKAAEPKAEKPAGLKTRSGAEMPPTASKLFRMVALVCRPGGILASELKDALGWPAGFSGHLGRQDRALGLKVKKTKISKGEFRVEGEWPCEEPNPEAREEAAAA
jgi:hypothetical protein